MPNQQSTQQDSANELQYNEVWEVYVSNQKEAYLLNEKEYAVLKKALLEGMKGFVHFDKFMLNTSFIVSTWRRSRKLKPEFILKDEEE